MTKEQLQEKKATLNKQLEDMRGSYNFFKEQMSKIEVDALQLRGQITLIDELLKEENKPNE